jgi:hypothetical protein
MTEQQEQAYIEGQRQVWVKLMRLCLSELGYDSAEATPHRWISEREEAISILRRLCDDFGDNEWDESLHLADIIDKHLGKYLEGE